MLTSYLAMQNAILAQNMATSRMMQNADNMMASVSFGNSLPLRPSFAQANEAELQIKTDETKVSVLQKIIDEAIQKKLGKDIEKSTPKYAGINYVA